MRIPLRRRDGSIRAYAIVDEADAHVAEQRWHLNGARYAARFVGLGGGRRGAEKKEIVYLHRALLGLAKGDRREVDHLNGDKLDNRRENLRVVTRHEQMQNIDRGRGIYRGVHRSGRGWIARVKVNGVTHRSRRFDTAEDAAAEARAMRARLMTHAVESRHESSQAAA